MTGDFEMLKGCVGGGRGGGRSVMNHNQHAASTNTTIEKRETSQTDSVIGKDTNKNKRYSHLERVRMLKFDDAPQKSNQH